MGGSNASTEEPQQLLPPAESLDAAGIEDMKASREDGSVSIDSPPNLRRPAVKSWRGDGRQCSEASPQQRHGFGEETTSKFNARGGGGGPHGMEDGGSTVVSSSVDMLGMLSVNVFGDQPHGNDGNGSSSLQVREIGIYKYAVWYMTT